ncbi:hypothetical protein LguiB_002565 [Lonicera macranthoides]
MLAPQHLKTMAKKQIIYPKILHLLCLLPLSFNHKQKGDCCSLTTRAVCPGRLCRINFKWKEEAIFVAKGMDYVFKCIEKANHAVTAVKTYYITFKDTSAARSDLGNTFQAMVHRGVADTEVMKCRIKSGTKLNSSDVDPEKVGEEKEDVDEEEENLEEDGDSEIEEEEEDYVLEKLRKFGEWGSMFPYYPGRFVPGADYVFKCIEKANHAVTAVETYYITFTATSAANSDCANTFQAMVHEGVIDTKKERLIFEGHIPSVHAICEAIEGNIYIEGILSDLKVASGDELMIYGLRTSGGQQFCFEKGEVRINSVIPLCLCKLLPRRLDLLWQIAYEVKKIWEMHAAVD